MNVLSSSHDIFSQQAKYNSVEISSQFSVIVGMQFFKANPNSYSGLQKM